MKSLLMDEEFVAVFPSLVKRLGGMNEAAVLQTIHFTANLSHVVLDGRRWTMLTAGEIGRRTGLSDDAVLRALTSLREEGVLLDRSAGDGTRRLMWSINREALEKAHRESAVTHPAKSRQPHRESAVSTTTKEGEDKPNNVVAIAENGVAMVIKAFLERWEKLYGAARPPDSSSIGRLRRDARRLLREGRQCDDLAMAATLCADRGHVNLPSSLLMLIAEAAREPKGFAGIREFLDDDPK